MKKLEKEIMEFSARRNWTKVHTPEHLAKSVVIEAAELLECFQWDNEHFDKVHVSEEIADTMIYCIQLCHVLGLDPETIIREKLEKNAVKYPIPLD